MKSRLETYRSLRRKKNLKYSLCSSLILLPSFYFMADSLSSAPVTFAWFTSESSTNGFIQNVRTSDLLRISTGKIIYGDNYKVKFSINISNISNLDTYVFVGLGKHWVSKQLHSGESFSFDLNDIDDIPNNAKIIQYQIKAFYNYVNETFAIAIDQDRLKDKNTQRSKEYNANQAMTETQSNKSAQENKSAQADEKNVNETTQTNGTSETTQTNGNNANEATQTNSTSETTQTDGNYVNEATQTNTPSPNPDEQSQNTTVKGD